MEPVPSSTGPRRAFQPYWVFGSPVTPGSTPTPGLRRAWSAACPEGTARHRALRQEAGSCRSVSSPPRRGIGGHRIAWFMLGDAGSAAAPVVHDHRADRGQGGAGGPVVVAAQQKINRMPAGRGGRDEDPHHRPGGAAAGPVTQIGPPGPGSPVIGGRSGSRAARRPAGLAGPAARKPHPHPASIVGLRPSQQGLSARPGEDLRP